MLNMDEKQDLVSWLASLDVVELKKAKVEMLRTMLMLYEKGICKVGEDKAKEWLKEYKKETAFLKKLGIKADELYE